ncbi:cyclin-domain-containing protein [Delphinella strobiligena]|nr:cyclin-domain-containing protein [Delphinella strobiligena]
MNSVAQNVQLRQYSYYNDRSATRYETEQSKHEPATCRQNQVNNNALPDCGASRADFQVNSIAPSLRIPRSVNNSQGSLAELAAQITCLFWFESSSTLERATYKYPLQSLAQDAIPTTGFRKWVTTILSTTQVAQNVIILALLFVYRLKKQNPSVKGKPGSEYRLLTVALMLGNKFLDDNTYTNKTWAEVSGISVAEVHIMEVEFLSNMKYNLFVAAEEWDEWQTQLGRFASFFEQASRVPSSQSPFGALGITLPSPPTSNHASPSYSGSQNLAQYSHPSVNSLHSDGTMSNPSSLGPVPDLHSQVTRKRSLEHSADPPAKRLAASSTNYGQSFPSGASTAVPSYNRSQFLPRVPLPTLATPQTQPPHKPYTGSSQSQQQQFAPQLPPLNYTQLSFGPSPTPTSSWAPTSAAMTAAVNHYSQTPLHVTPMPQSMPQSRQQSPYSGSAGVSPTNSVLPSARQMHSSQLSPSYYLEQRNSPYRPIRGVSTLLVPPPSGATQHQQTVGREQMHYQPLGRPQERQTGQLPYIAQNQWFDGRHQSTASAYQWPSFLPSHHNQQHHQPQLPLPTPSFGRT